jgi:hypothetical protein
MNRNVRKTLTSLASFLALLGAARAALATGYEESITRQRAKALSQMGLCASNVRV